MLTMRRRGKNGIYYFRGSVALGTKRIDVKEFSAGTSDADASSHLIAQYETNLRNELMFGASAKLVDATIADAFNSYLSKTPPPCPSDVIRVGKLNQIIGDIKLDDLQNAWTLHRTRHLSGHMPSGQDRYRAVLQAAVNVHRGDYQLDPIRLKGITFKNQRVRFLSLAERDRLIGSYASHVQPIATMLAFHGPRVQTALQIRWGAMGVDMDNRSILFSHSKTSTMQAVPMHDRVHQALLPLWLKAGQESGRYMFLNSRGVPYQDTRKSKIPGGNPLKRTHATACRRAEINDFAVHDWRHHWASHCVRAGIAMSIVNPRQVRDFARATGQLAKTDALDAGIILRFADAMKPVPTPPTPANQARLAEQVRRRRQLVDMLATEKQRLSGLDDVDTLASIRDHLAFLKG